MASHPGHVLLLLHSSVPFLLLLLSTAWGPDWLRGAVVTGLGRRLIRCPHLPISATLEWFGQGEFEGAAEGESVTETEECFHARRVKAERPDGHTLPHLTGVCGLLLTLRTGRVLGSKEKPSFKLSSTEGAT